MSHMPTIERDVIDVDAPSKNCYSDLPLFGYCATEPSKQSVNTQNEKIKISEKTPSPVISQIKTTISRKTKNSKSVSATSLPMPSIQISQAEIETNSVLLTVSDICKLLKVSRSTLIRMEKSGYLPGRMMLGGSVRYHRETIAAWLRDLATNPP